MATEQNKAISISLFAVSSGFGDNNEKALKLIIDCPKGYFFTGCVLEVKIGDNQTDRYELSTALFGAKNTTDEKTDHWNIVIPLSMLGIDRNAIYTIQLTASDATIENEEGEDGNITGATITYGSETLNATAYASDVEGSFNCMLAHILNSDPCEAVSDDVIRNYLILFGHQAALREGDVASAWEYFKLLDNCFNKCGNEHTSKVSPCNCGR